MLRYGYKATLKDLEGYSDSYTTGIYEQFYNWHPMGYSQRC